MAATTAAPKLSRREILAQWNPDNEQFWNQYGKKSRIKLNRFYNRFDPFLLCMDIMVNDCRKA